MSDISTISGPRIATPTSQTPSKVQSDLVVPASATLGPVTLKFNEALGQEVGKKLSKSETALRQGHEAAIKLGKLLADRLPAEGGKFAAPLALANEAKGFNDATLSARPHIHLALAALGSTVTVCEEGLPGDTSGLPLDEWAPALGELSRGLAAGRASMGVNNEAPLTGTPSFQDILDGLQDLIGIIGSDYLDVYAQLVSAYSELYKEFNDTILAKLAEWTFGDDSTGKGRVRINVVELGKALDDLIAKYSAPNAEGVLFPVPGADGSVSGASKEDAEKWLKAMGLPASCLHQLADGSYCVSMDLSPLTSMLDSLPPIDYEEFAILFPAEFQAWQGGFNAQQQAMESALQQFTQKYVNANSIHDNVQKIMSSTISSLMDMLKAFANSLG